MYSLGIESTAHTFGIGIVDNTGAILADQRDIFIPPVGWGIKPMDAAQHHEKVKQQLLDKALKEAKLSLDQIDVVSFSQGAGLPPCLKVGKEFSTSLGKPLVPVCHQVGHLEIAKLLTDSKKQVKPASSLKRDPVFLYVSGGNTQILSLASGRYRVFGETQDVGIGNALDKFAREVGLQFPGGPKIEALAKEGSYVELPYVVKGMDLSFSGILTAALQKRKKHSLEDLAFSLQETIFAMLAEVTERALAHTGKSEVVITGGVAANQRLCQMLEIMCSERGAVFRACPLKYSGDNGVMIAWNGLQIHQSGSTSDDASKKQVSPASSVLDIHPRLRTDDVDVSWVS